MARLRSLPGKMIRLRTRPTSSRLAQLHLRRQRARRPDPFPGRCITNGNAPEGQVPGRRRDHPSRANRALALTERTQTRPSSSNSSSSTTPTDRSSTWLASRSSTSFLDKMGLALSARAAPFRRHRLVLVLSPCREGWVVARTG